MTDIFEGPYTDPNEDGYFFGEAFMIGGATAPECLTHYMRQGRTEAEAFTRFLEQRGGQSRRILNKYLAVLAMRNESAA